MKISFSKLITRLCAVMIALLGFNSCDDEKVGGGDLCMYGSPTGTFEIKGHVTTEDGKDVGDAEIRVTSDFLDSGICSFGTASTDADGKYIIEENEFLPKIKVVCLPSDDTLEADSLLVNLKYEGRNNDDSWNWGHAKATVDFKLKKKENRTEEE